MQHKASLFALSAALYAMLAVHPAWGTSDNSAPPAKAGETLELPVMPDNNATSNNAPPAKPQLPAKPSADMPKPALVQPSLPVSLPVIPLPNTSGHMPLPGSAKNPEKTEPSTENTSALPVPSAPAGQAAAPSAATEPATAHTNLTIMFSSDEMDTISTMIKAYDSYDARNKQDQKQKKDLRDIFGNEPEQQILPHELPNIYLGSIVYTSPGTWIVTINGRRISASHNAPTNEFYISKISRKEVELVWKPHSLNDLPDKWNQMTEGGKTHIPNIVVDSANNMVTLNMHPNQTFISSSLQIREGLIRPDGSFFAVKGKESPAGAAPTK